ncbi:MAG: urease accessory protein UreD [Actinomycetota bacterium]|nr:urease accessory protein UreD [Actinomycetota bacterium]
METTTTPMITPTRTSSAGRSPNGQLLNGQRGELSLTLARRGGRSALTRRYASAPFGSVRAAYPDGSGIPELQVTNPSGGILGGDHLRMEIVLRPGAAATVLTQGAAKAYRGPESCHEAAFSLGEGTFLEYLPHHLIPYAGSRHRLRTEFRLRKSSALLAWESVSAGRLARGERFAFDRLSSRTRLCVDGRPEAADGFELSGGDEHFGGYSYLGTVLAWVPEGEKALAEKLQQTAQGNSILASASAPCAGLCVVRILSTNAEALYSTLNPIRDRVRDFLGLPLAPRDVR